MNSGENWSSNLFNLGMSSYQSGNYAHAVMMFSQTVRSNKDHWQARFYLAESCLKARMYGEASINFRDIVEGCPDADLRQRASVALDELESTSVVNWLLQALQSFKLSATA